MFLYTIEIRLMLMQTRLFELRYHLYSPGQPIVKITIKQAKSISSKIRSKTKIPTLITFIQQSI